MKRGLVKSAVLMIGLLLVMGPQVGQTQDAGGASEPQPIVIPGVTGLLRYLAVSPASVEEGLGGEVYIGKKQDIGFKADATQKTVYVYKGQFQQPPGVASKCLFVDRDISLVVLPELNDGAYLNILCNKNSDEDGHNLDTFVGWSTRGYLTKSNGEIVRCDRWATYQGESTSSFSGVETVVGKQFVAYPVCVETSKMEHK